MVKVWIAVASAVVLAGVVILINAVGGFATVAPTPIPTIAAGAEVQADPITLTIDGARLVDEDSRSGAYPEEGERLLVIEVTAVNTWTRPVTADLLERVIRRGGVDEPGSVARSDDGTRTPVLQPGIPAPLTFTWAVPADEFHGGDDLELEINKHELQPGGFIIRGDVDPVLTATTTVTLTDEGAGDAGGDSP